MIKRDKEPDDQMPEPSTYFQHAQAQISLEETTGRFANAEVIGTKRVAQYPAASGHWNVPMPDEEPLGQDVTQVEAVGTPEEIQASLKKGEEKP